MHIYHSFQSEFCSGCLERLYAASRRACAPVLAPCSLFRIVGTASSAGSLWGRLGSRSALRRVNPEAAARVAVTRAAVRPWGLCLHSYGVGVGRRLSGVNRSSSPPQGLAPTRYRFTQKLYCGSLSSLYCSSPTCKAYPIAILLHGHCAIYPPRTDPPLLCHTPYNIGDGSIV